VKKYFIHSFILLIIFSCGGGGGASPDPIIAPSISIDGPSTISWSNSGPVGCTGSGIDDCIKLTANINDPQGRITTAQWQNLNTLGGPCYPVTTNANVMSVPLYCTSAGYSCQYSYDVSWFNGTSTKYIQPFFTANIQGPIPCASGSAVDGYIQDAIIFSDVNENLTKDGKEMEALTDAFGKFDFNRPLAENTLLVLIGGIDSSTGMKMPDNYKLLGRVSNTEHRIISPISTMKYFMGKDYVISSDLNLKTFDVLINDPVSSITDAEASLVLSTNMKISILVESISKITDELDYFKIYPVIADTLKSNNLGLLSITSEEIIYESINKISSKEIIIKNNIPSRLSDFLNSIKVIDNSNSHLQSFEYGMSILPLELSNIK
tara:strand:- start:184 stop:1317 length:1134 start_codon:yes stop_codon:yes gene_type:complete